MKRRTTYQKRYLTSIGEQVSLDEPANPLWSNVAYMSTWPTCPRHNASPQARSSLPAQTGVTRTFPRTTPRSDYSAGDQCGFALPPHASPVAVRLLFPQLSTVLSPSRQYMLESSLFQHHPAARGELLPVRHPPRVRALRRQDETPFSPRPHPLFRVQPVDCGYPAGTHVVTHLPRIQVEPGVNASQTDGDSVRRCLPALRKGWTVRPIPGRQW